ncbi:arginase family protein [Enhygromyxa salina]|uniref:arginase family protein n=1 Tax=Enhygromyxa salina TaxID=215803 RepID=UPI0015E5ADC5|nr:arginase family protein [Enhygromyxa salina]
MRSEPDQILELTPDALVVLERFATPARVDEVLPGASAEMLAFIETLVELELLVGPELQPPPYGWEAPLQPMFRLPVWPNVLPGSSPPIVVLGARFDDATSSAYPRGARDGPTALRRAGSSFPLRVRVGVEAAGLPHVELGERMLVGAVMADAGDLVTDPGCAWPVFAAALEARMRLLGERARCLLLGGDHSVTLPALRALAEVHPGGFGVLHFDAHGDLGPVDEPATVTHANVMRHALALPQVAKLVQVGVRGFQALPPERDAYRRFTAADVERDPESIVAAVDPQLPWYVSVDVDVLDPSVAPGTGAPEPDGLRLRQLREALRACLLGRRVVGADLVECHDQPGDRLTGRVGAQIVLELADLMDRGRP